MGHVIQILKIHSQAFKEKFWRESAMENPRGPKSEGIERKLQLLGLPSTPILPFSGA